MSTKIDGRSKAAREAKKQTITLPESQSSVIEDPYTEEWTQGFNLIKAGDPLPSDATPAMMEGGRAAQQQPALIQQAQQALSRPVRNQYAGYEVERGAAEEDHSPPSGDDWVSPTLNSSRQAPVMAAPQAEAFRPQIFAAPQRPAPPSPDAAFHQRRAADVIRQAQTRAARETAIAQAFLENPGSENKKKAFIAFCESLTEAPEAPPLGPYGDKAEDYMLHMADWHPEEFLAKYAKCGAKLAVQLRSEINAR